MVITGKKRADHYLPAALIGGFGIPSTQPGKTGLRHATVAVREHSQPHKIEARRAETIARKVGEYWVARPPAGVSPNFIDGYWDQYEPQSPWSGSALRKPRLDHQRLDNGAQAPHRRVGAPSRFRARGNRLPRARGNPITNRDEVQDERLVTLANTPSLLARARFAILRTPEDGNRFVINDKGYATVEDVELSQKGVLFPLSGVAAILGVFEAGVVTGRVDAWLCADLTLTPGAVETWNLASWQHKETLCIIGHPSDKERMARLDAWVSNASLAWPVPQAREGGPVRVGIRGQCDD